MNTHKRKILTKVRRNFIHKTPDENEEAPTVPVPQEVGDHPIQIIDTSVGIVEMNGKIYVGDRFLNSVISIHNIQVKSQPTCKAVTFDIQLNQSFPQLPWEYYVKRLESFGDLSLATWAQKLRNHHTVYPKVMAEYSLLTKTDDSAVFANLRRIKNQISLAQKEIESNYAYKSVTMFTNGVTTAPVKTSYSEGFLREVDHTVEDFIEKVKENGIPKLFSGESPFHQQIGKMFLDCSVYKGEAVKYGPIYTTWIYDKNERKKKVTIQMALIVDPVAEGVFITGYAILKKQEEPYFYCKEDFDVRKLKSIKEQPEQEVVDEEKIKILLEEEKMEDKSN